MKKLLFLLTLLTSVYGYTQTTESENYFLVGDVDKTKLNQNDVNLIDSILILYHKSSNDSVKILLLDVLSNELADGKLWPKYNQLEYELAVKGRKNNPESNFYISYEGQSLNNIGYFFNKNGEMDKAMKSYLKAMDCFEKIDIGEGVGMIYNNIGLLYFEQEDMKNALLYYQKSLSVREKIADTIGIAMSHINLGGVFMKEKNIESALENIHAALAIYGKRGDLYGMAHSHVWLGFIYAENKEKDKALDYYQQSLEIREKIGDKEGIEVSLRNIGDLYFNAGDIDLAYQYAKRSMDMANELQYPINLKNSAELLRKVYLKKGNYKKAYEAYALYVEMNDSIMSQEKQNQFIRQQYKYEYEKQATKDSIKVAEAKKVTDAQIATQNAQLEQERTQKIALYGGLVLLFLFGGFMYNRYRKTQEQKNTIELQKQLVDEKNQEIMDSITYAKRIQSAILPPNKLVKECLPDSFILYKPKDIVAGDFYWMELVKKERHSALDAESPKDKDSANLGEIAGQARNDGNLVLFAAADCTGHGVPGAMVSVVCNNALNRSVREYSLTDPGEILNKTREIVIAEFEKSDEEVKDGMDIALCSLELNSPFEGGERGMTLKYAGAHNPLWIIRNGEIIETKANKQPIGQFDYPEPYITHSFELQKGDTIYIFSDGFVDQFGGEKGKKFKARGFRELLISIQDKPMEEQSTIIDEAFEAWKGDLEQIDDVCIIGVRILSL